MFLGATAPFDGLGTQALHDVAAAATVVDHPAGAEIMDAFAHPGDELFVVLSGQVELWTAEDAWATAPADEVLGRGCVFGHSSVLTGAALGPRAVALGPVRLVEIPRKAVAEAFLTPAGMRLLAHDFSGVATRARRPPFRVVDDLVVAAPIVGDEAMTVAEAARTMTERGGCGYLAVPRADGGYGLVTDAVLRERVIAAGRPPDTPVREVMIPRARTATTGTPTVEVLREFTECPVDHLLVVDPSGALKGAVEPQDLLAAPSAVGVLLGDQIRRAETLDQVVALARRMPGVLSDLVEQRRDAADATSVYSILVDAVQRKVLSLVLAAHDDLREAEVTWMLLGSNARREPMLGSDIDSAVVFAETVDTPARAAAYREAFAEVARVLRRGGLKVDEHGATPGSPPFSRTRSQWRAAAGEWLARPLDGEGMLMASLLLDGRPIQGDPARPVVQEVFADVRDHPGTMKLLIQESLSHRARLRSVRQVLAGRGGTFDLKSHALRPIVEIARWAAASVGSSELSTHARLAAASGSALLPADQARTLSEVFDVLQRIRLRHQVAQYERGEPVSDVVWMARLAPLDRGLVAQSVREIAAVQRRLANLLNYTSPDEWRGTPLA